MKSTAGNLEVRRLSKFLQVEFGRTAKLFLGLILSIIVVNLLMYPTIASLSESNTLFQGLAMSFLVVLMFVLNLLFLFMIISYFRRDLYHDSRYLIFSLPVSSKGYLGAKLINSVFWIIMLLIGTLALNYAAMTYTFGAAEINTFFDYLSNNIISSPIIVVLFILYSLISLVYTLVLMYFCIILSKTLFRSNRLGYFWILFYILLSSLLEYGISYISRTIPLFVMANNAEFRWITMTEELAVNGGMLNDPNSLTLFTGISLVSLFLYTATTILLFVLSAKLLEKKVDL